MGVKIDKKQYLNLIFYIVGSFIVLAVMVNVSVNFVKDGRLFDKRSVIAAENEQNDTSKDTTQTNAADKTSDTDSFKTFNYERKGSTTPSSGSTSSSASTKSSSGTTSAPVTTAPATTAQGTTNQAKTTQGTSSPGTTKPATTQGTTTPGTTTQTTTSQTTNQTTKPGTTDTGTTTQKNAADPVPVQNSSTQGTR